MRLEVPLDPIRDLHPSCYWYFLYTLPRISLVARHDVHVEVRNGLPSRNAVVLNKLQACWLICVTHCSSDSDDTLHHCGCLVRGKVKDCRNVSLRNHKSSARLELARINKSKCCLPILNHRTEIPSRDVLTEWAWISLRQIKIHWQQHHSYPSGSLSRTFYLRSEQSRMSDIL